MCKDFLKERFWAIRTFLQADSLSLPNRQKSWLSWSKLILKMALIFKTTILFLERIKVFKRICFSFISNCTENFCSKID